MKICQDIFRDANLSESKLEIANFTFFDPKICCSKCRSSDLIVQLHQISKTFSAKIYQKDEFYVFLYVLSLRFGDSDGRVGDSVCIRRLPDNPGEFA